LAKGAVVRREIKIDQPIHFDDVEVAPSTVYSLWKLQNQWMSGEITDDALLRAIDALED
jgi:predicted homoserine dehydrogenase-like protein